MSENLDIVDDSDEVTGAMSRDQVHAEGHRHRTAHVYIRRQDGYLLMQLRAHHLAGFPGRWDCAASGHVASGESYLDAARREVAEEVGTTLSPAAFQPLQKLRFDGGDSEFAQTFLVRVFEPNNHKLSPSRDVAELRWMDPRGVDALSLADVTPHFAESWDAHRSTFLGKP